MRPPAHAATTALEAGLMPCNRLLQCTRRVMFARNVVRVHVAAWSRFIGNGAWISTDTGCRSRAQSD